MEQKPFQKKRDNAKIHKSSRNFKLLATVVCTAVALFTLYGNDHGAVTAIAKGYATVTTPAGFCSAPLWGDVYVASLKPFSWWNCEYFDCLFNVSGTVTDCNEFNVSGEVPDCDDYNVIGEVTDCNGAPLFSLRVTGYLTGDEDSVYYTVTDSKGRYRLQFPAYSDVTITVKSSDYGNYTPEVSYNIKGKGAGSWVQKIIKLPCVNVCFWNGDTAVVINNVTWATRNVDAPGTFAAYPESYGMFYQWNRKIGWSSTDPLVNSNGGDASTWDDSTPSGDEWESANDPSPAGWRVPTYDEILTLLDIEKVSYEWTTFNGVYGGLFTDKTTNKSVFLPAAGYRYSSGGTLYGAGTRGYCWSSAQISSDGAYYLRFGSGYAAWNHSLRMWGLSVRCVAE